MKEVSGQKTEGPSERGGWGERLESGGKTAKGF